MNDLISKLFKAHVEHELNFFQGDLLKKTLNEEVTIFFEWIQTVKLKDIFSFDQIVGIIDRNVVDLPVSGGITELVGEMSRQVLNSKQNKKVSFKDIFSRKLFDDIIDKIISMEKARMDIIKSSIQSSAYSKLVSHIFLTTINKYLFENVIIKKIRGVKPIFKRGSSPLNQFGTKTEQIVKKHIENLVANNIDDIVKISGKFITEYFDESFFIETGDEIWDSITKGPLSNLFNFINSSDLEDFVIMVYEFWLNYRKSKYFEGIYRELVRQFFKKYKNSELDIILQDVGVSKEMVMNEAINLLIPWFAKAIDSGYLEKRIRAHLESFYLSKKVAGIAKNNS